MTKRLNTDEANGWNDRDQAEWEDVWEDEREIPFHETAMGRLVALRYTIAKIALSLGLVDHIPGPGYANPDDKQIRDAAFDQRHGWKRLVKLIGKQALVDKQTAHASFKVLGKEVAEEAHEYQVALDRELIVEADVLRAMLEAIRPAADALSFRIPTGKGILSERRGFFLTTDGVLGKRTDGSSDKAFYATPELEIRCVQYEGFGSDWRVVNDTVATGEDALKEVHLKDVADHLRILLHRQLTGNKQERIKEMAERASKLRLLAASLRRPDVSEHDVLPQIRILAERLITACKTAEESTEDRRRQVQGELAKLLKVEELAELLAAIEIKR